MPRISVFIPAFNAERYIAEAIESVLGQTYSDFELLLIDDASIDATAAIMQRYTHDARVRVIRHAYNRQRPETRNEGVALARGRYIALLDADDYATPERLARQAAFLDGHPDIDVVGSWWHRIDDTGHRLAPKKSRRYLSSDAVEAWLLFRCTIHNPTVMARTRALAGYAYDPAFPIAEDYDVWARMLGRHRFAIMPEPLTAYREHASQVSRAQARDSLYFRQRVQARQLRALGMVFNDDDLRCHSLLYTGRKLFRIETGQEMGLAYVRWAQRWLEQLLAANANRCVYPASALSDLVARLWWFVCRKSAKHGGPVVWSAFMASPLSRLLPRAWLRDAWLATRARR